MKTIKNEEVLVKSFEIKEEQIICIGEHLKFVYVDLNFIVPFDAPEFGFEEETVGVLRLYNVDLKSIESYSVFSMRAEDSDTSELCILLDIENDGEFEVIDFLNLFNIDVEATIEEKSATKLIGYRNITEQSITYFLNTNELNKEPTINFITEKPDGRFTFFVHYDIEAEQIKFDFKGNVTLTCNIFKDSYTVRNPMFRNWKVFYQQLTVPVQKNDDGVFKTLLEIDGKRTVTIDELKELPLIQAILFDSSFEPQL